MYVDVHCLDESRPIKSCLAKTATSLRSGMKTANALLCQHSLKRKMSESLHTLRFTPMLLLTTQPKFQRALAPLPSCLVLGHEDQCADKRKDLRFGTWTRLNLGKFARVAFRVHRTCKLWLLTLNVQLLLPWLRTTTRLCSWSLTQRISSFQEIHVLLFYVLCSQNTVKAMISLFWEESAFQHWSLQNGQGFTNVVDTSLVHKRRVGSTSTLLAAVWIDMHQHYRRTAKDISQHQTLALSRRWTRCFFMPFETLWF